MSPFAYKYLVLAMLHNVKVLRYFLVESQYRQDFASPNKKFFYKMSVILQGKSLFKNEICDVFAVRISFSRPEHRFSNFQEKRVSGPITWNFLF